MKNTQRLQVLRQFRDTGFVSRNWAIRTAYITRLSGIICTLNKEGYKIVGKKKKGDYIYTLIEAPKGTICNPTRLVEIVDENGNRKMIYEE